MRLTEKTKQAIKQMRLENLGYKKIAQQLDISLATVQSYCRRNNLTPDDLSINVPKMYVQCLNCGATLQHEVNRPSKKFCSDRCRNQHWYNQKCSKSTNETPVTKVFCICCGKKHPFIVKMAQEEVFIRGITISYQEQTAYCIECGNEVYVPITNDNNALARERAYRKTKKSTD